MNNDKTTGINFTYEKVYMKETINQIKMFLKAKHGNYCLYLNGVWVSFDKLEYEEFEYDEGQYCYDFSF